MMVYESFRSFILYRKRIALFNIGRLAFMDRITVHVKIVYSDFGSCIWNILECDYVAFKTKLKLLGCLSRLIVLSKNISISSLSSKIFRVCLDCQFHSIRS